MDTKIRVLREWIYWYARRPMGKLGRKIIWMLPKKVVYWCVIRAAVLTEPNTNPSSVTAEEMLKALDIDG